MRCKSIVVAMIAVTVAIHWARLKPASRALSALCGATERLQGGYAYVSPPLPQAMEQTNHLEELKQAVAQWPERESEQLIALNERRDRVVRRLNQATGAACIVRIGQTERAAVSNGDWTVTVDPWLLWRLSEDGLASILAHEMGHEVLRHAELMQRIESDVRQGVPGIEHRHRELERAADEFAGRIIAIAGYRPEGFAEALRTVASTEWEPPSVRLYYPHEGRLMMFSHGYQLGQNQVLHLERPQVGPAPITSRVSSATGRVVEEGPG